MLPTTGYFKDIDCPYYDTSCGRPYCHFRHRKKNQEQESSEDTQEAETVEETIPQYKPTPKSELANTKSHIPIRYVPDLVVKSDRRPIRTFNFAERPTYKPTPISLLSSTNVAKDIEYTPTSVCSAISNEKTESKSEETPEDLDLEKLSMEFDMIDEILSDTVKTDGNTNTVELDKDKKGKTDSSRDKKSQSKKKSEIPKSNELKEKKEERHRKDKYSRTSSSSSSKSSHRDKEASKDKTRDKEKSSDKSKKSEKSRLKEKEKIKESEKTKDKCKEKSKDKSKENEKHKERTKENEKHKDRIKENEKRKDRSKENEKHKDKSKENERHKDKSKENEKSKIKTKERGKSKEKEKNRNSESRHKSKTSSSKSSDERQSKYRDKHSEKLRLESGSSSDDHIDKLENEVSSYYNFHESEEDEDNFDSVEQECYKIFNEYVPPIVSSGTKNEDMNQESDLPEPVYIPTKKRIAHDNAGQATSKVLFTKTNPVPNVALMINQRIKIAKQKQAENEGQNLINEINRQNLKRPVPDNKSEIKKRKISLSLYKSIKSSNGESIKNKEEPKPVSLVDEIINLKTKPIRIAPVQNVNSIQRAKAKIQEQLKNIKPIKTQAQTISRGAKRTAHVPEDSLGELPDVLHAEASKLPVNVRTRYLTMLADECVKLYVYREDAHQRALTEEFKCYEKCSALITYRNSAMLAVNRIRKEVKERENSGLGPINSGESSKTNSNSPLEGEAFYNNILQYVLSEEELVLHGYPRESSTPGRADIHSEKPSLTEHLESNERLCCRCHKLYQVDDYGFPLNQQDCIYHPLRKRTLRGERTYLCCKSTEDTGCVVSKTHVCEIMNGTELDGYQSTMDPEKSNDPRSTAVYALDCEMCYTIVGLELTRVTIVDTNLKTVYETLVKPLNPIIDYNTRFSGITKEQMDRTSTSILQVQANILHLCNSKTILIGHSLESDMKALKIIHSTIIDTSVMFPHKFGLPHKRALKMLASEYLRKIIQNDVGGHDSAEDALACMELVLWKVKEDLKVKTMK